MTTGSPAVFNSYFMAGFPGATQVPRNGRRVEAIERCGHQQFYAQDYARARRLGLLVARESVQWSAVERLAGHYDFAFARRRLHSARAQGIQIVWTLLDGGWPSDIDVMRPAFVERFVAYARAFARMLRDQEAKNAIVVPINEIGPLARRGGELALAFPFLEERGLELRCQLVRAAVAAIDVMRDTLPDLRFMHVEPLMHIATHPFHPEDADAAETMRREQYAVMDMITGRTWPQLGGREHHLDLLGVSHYLASQNYYAGPRHPGKMINPQANEWRRLSDMLVEASRRYACPLVVAATGHDGAGRAAWLRYVCREVQHAGARGAGIRGVCLQPVIDSPARFPEACSSAGLWGEADVEGERSVDMWLAKELREQQRVFARLGQDGAQPPGTEPVLADRPRPASDRALDA